MSPADTLVFQLEKDTAPKVVRTDNFKDSHITLNPSIDSSLFLSSTCSIFISPRKILKVTNTSGTKVAFKVKTTQPTWYYVRPNQQVVNVGCTEEVAIVLVDAECS
jgi:MSP (Major sperm protein) domain